MRGRNLVERQVAGVVTEREREGVGAGGGGGEGVGLPGLARKVGERQEGGGIERGGEIVGEAAVAGEAEAEGERGARRVGDGLRKAAIGAHRAEEGVGGAADAAEPIVGLAEYIGERRGELPSGEAVRKIAVYEQRWVCLALALNRRCGLGGGLGLGGGEGLGGGADDAEKDGRRAAPDM